jgi:DNA-binding SARP family transcriptional activator
VDPPLEVAVLGRVGLGVGGRPIRPARPKATELLAFLALQPRGAGAEQVWDALWPDRPLNRGLLHTTVSAARRAIGATGAVELGIADARGGGVYGIRGEVRVDWHRFRGHVARGELAVALDLVHGPPFSTTEADAYGWALGLRADAEAVVATAAARLARRRLDDDDAVAARAAVRAGLLAVPYDERLYRLLVRVADVAGSAGEAAAARAEMRAVLGVVPP